MRRTLCLWAPGAALLILLVAASPFARPGAAPRAPNGAPAATQPPTHTPRTPPPPPPRAGAAPIAFSTVAAILSAPQQPPARRTGGVRPTGPVALADCTTSGCHSDVKEHAFLHGPVGVNACDACHQVVDESRHTFTIAREGLGLCTFCHDVKIEDAAFVHEPLRSGQCTACHSPHGGSQPNLLKADSVATLCRQCHEDVIGGRRHVHGPVAAGACVVCHSPHTSEHPNLLFAEGPDLCTQCHAQTKAQLETARYVHEPVTRDCLTCHDGHATDHRMMLKNEPQPLCLGCHETIKHTVETAKTQHAAVTTERECLNCHSPHASDYPRILENDMLSLCFECHDRVLKLPDGSKLGNIKKVIETGTSLHGPIAQANCAACHQIHGGDNFRLLVREYPPEFYAPFAEERYALCFSCHDPQLVRDPHTTALTNFRNGDLNLHYLHVNRERKGRTCRACHETHAAGNNLLIRNSVPFGPGGWELPINYRQLSNGGACSPGCHEPYQYDRVAPVQYAEPGQPAIWPGESNPATPPTTPPATPTTPSSRGAPKQGDAP